MGVYRSEPLNKRQCLRLPGHKSRARKPTKCVHIEWDRPTTFSEVHSALSAPDGPEETQLRKNLPPCRSVTCSSAAWVERVSILASTRWVWHASRLWSSPEQRSTQPSVELAVLERPLLW